PARSSHQTTLALQSRVVDRTVAPTFAHFRRASLGEVKPKTDPRSNVCPHVRFVLNLRLSCPKFSPAQYSAWLHSREAEGASTSRLHRELWIPVLCERLD